MSDSRSSLVQSAVHSTFAVVGHAQSPVGSRLAQRCPLPRASTRILRGDYYTLFGEKTATVVRLDSQTHAISEGYATVADRIVHGPPLAKRLGHDGLSRWGQQSYSYLICGEKELRAGTDWLGLRQIYYSSHGPGVSIISNDLSWHVLLMHELGLDPRPDLATLLLVAASGSPLSAATSIDGVKLLAPTASCRFLRCGQLQVEPGVRISKELAKETTTELRRLAAEEIRVNLRTALATLPDRRHVIELTGGADSRLVLAAVLSLGLQDHFTYFTRGGDGADVAVAAELRATFGLQSTSNPESYEDISLSQFLEASRICGGQRDVQAVSFFMHARYEDRVVYTGGHGETFRSLYGTALTSRGMAPAKLDATESRNEELAHLQRGLLQRRVLWRAHERVVMARMALVRDNLNGRNFGERLQHLYADYRNRYHFGLFAATRFPHVPCFQPLQSEAAVALSHRIPSSARAQSVVTFELIEHLFPSLVLHRFAELSLPATYLRDKPWADYIRGADERALHAPLTNSPPETHLGTNQAATVASVRQSFVDATLRMCETLSTRNQALLGLEAIYRHISECSPRVAFGLARHFVGALGWIRWLEGLAERRFQIPQGSMAENETGACSLEKPESHSTMRPRGIAPHWGPPEGEP